MNFDFTKDQLHVTVRDTGIGIKEEDRQRLFDMFCRLETSLSTSTSGIGLGLSISYQIVNALGGNITINPLSPGSPDGTSITFVVKAYSIMSISSTRIEE